jgi:hypothetical protein
MDDVDLGRHLEQLGAQLVEARDPARGEVELAGLRAGKRDQLVYVADRQRRMHHQHRGDVRDERDRREVGDRVEGHARVQELVHRVRAHRAEEERIAVGRRARGRLGPDVAGGAGAILDEHRLAPLLSHLLRDHAPEDVGGAARRPRYDHAHRLRWIRLRCNVRRGERQEEKGNDE